MNEVTKEGYSAIEQALRDEVIEPKMMPKRFERRDTMVLPIPDSAAERVAHSRAEPAVYVKPDQGKLRWDLLPQDALEQVVPVREGRREVGLTRVEHV